jgi:hypothetical protein
MFDQIIGGYFVSRPLGHNGMNCFAPLLVRNPNNGDLENGWMLAYTNPHND